MKMILPKCNCQYGAPMGRRNNIPDRSASPKLRLQKLEWVNGDYDEGGAYWGRGIVDFDKGLFPTYIFWAKGDAEGVDETFNFFIRASNRNEAKQKICQVIPKARFYR